MLLASIVHTYSLNPHYQLLLLLTQLQVTINSFYCIMNLRFKSYGFVYRRSRDGVMVEIVDQDRRLFTMIDTDRLNLDENWTIF